mgnify:CR=1 FL=1
MLCNELNFTVDSESAAKVIYNCPKVSLLTAQCTQDAVYHLEDLEEMLDMNSNFMRWSRSNFKRLDCKKDKMIMAIVRCLLIGIYVRQFILQIRNSLLQSKSASGKIMQRI